jgi:hypothetical protein
MNPFNMYNSKPSQVAQTISPFPRTCDSPTSNKLDVSEFFQYSNDNARQVKQVSILNVDVT